MDSNPKEFYNLEGLPKQVQLMHHANCMQKFQGYESYKHYQQPEQIQQQSSILQSLYIQIAKFKSPPQNVSVADITLLDQYNGDYFTLCQQEAIKYVVKYMKQECDEYEQCLSTCQTLHSKESLLNLPKRTKCNKKCETALDMITKDKIADGSFPGVKELIK